MLNKRVLKIVLSVFLLATVLLSQTSDVFAQGRGKPGQGPGPHPDPGQNFYYTPHYTPHGRAVNNLPGGYLRMIIGGLEYFYWEGMFYRMTSNRYTVVSAPVGAVVTTIPQGSQPVIVDGTAYYNINGVTYMDTPEGYQVVPQPKTIVVKKYVVEQKSSTNTADIEQSTAADTGESFTVNIPNSKKGYSAVTLKRSGSGFIGPQGEYYAEFPKIAQLKVMYAK